MIIYMIVGMGMMVVTAYLRYGVSEAIIATGLCMVFLAFYGMIDDNFRKLVNK